MKKLFALLFITLLVPTIIFASSTISTNITTGGNVGIGSTTPYSRLSIDNTSVATGEELITNGTFTGGTTGWTLGNNVAYGSNNVVSTYAGGDPSLSTTFDVVSGRTYLISYTISNAGSGVLAYFWTNNGTYDDPPEGNGTHTHAYKATNTGTETITFDDWNYLSGDTFTLDNVSVKEASEILPVVNIQNYNGETILSLGGDIRGSLAMGASSLVSNTTGYGNSAFGRHTLKSNTTGYVNSAFGYAALMSNTTGYVNSAFGKNALLSNTSGIYNNAFGYGALDSNTTGSYNNSLGTRSLDYNTTGSNNIAVGYDSLGYNQSATNTTAIGYKSGRGTSPFSNQGGVYVGYQSGYSAGNSSDYNTLIGYQSGYGITTGKNNIVLGTATSSTSVNNITTGSQNILIGNNIGLPSSTASGQLNIGNTIFGTGITSTGTTVSGGSIGIGIASPTSQFQVATSSSNATTTVTFGKTGQNKGSCLELYDATGAVKYISVQANALVVSATSCK